MKPVAVTVVQLVIGAALVLVAALVDDIRHDPAAFGVLIGLGGTMLGNIAPSPIEWSKRNSVRPPPPPPPVGK